MSKKRNARRRTRNVLLIVSMMLVVAMASVGGTLAWLTASTTEIVNTFSPSDIGINLTESSAREFHLVPGVEYKKDPIVAVDTAKTDVDIYLFVEFNEVNNPGTYLNYTSTLTEDNGWLQDSTLPNNVWYRIVSASDTSAKEWHLLEGDKVTVLSTLEKDNMPLESEKPQLTYKAYAIQVAGFSTPELAWDEVSTLAAVTQ